MFFFPSRDMATVRFHEPVCLYFLLFPVCVHFTIFFGYLRTFLLYSSFFDISPSFCQFSSRLSDVPFSNDSVR